MTGLRFVESFFDNGGEIYIERYEDENGGKYNLVYQCMGMEKLNDNGDWVAYDGEYEVV